MTPKLPSQEELDDVARLMGINNFNQLRGTDSALKMIEIAVQMRILAAIKELKQ